MKPEQALVGLVTNVGRKAIDQALARFGLPGFLNAVVTRDDVEFLKPSGEGIRAALRKLGADAGGAIFIGDSVTDILAARDAGVSIAIIQGGESNAEALCAARPTFYFRSLQELQRHWERHLIGGDDRAVASVG